MLSIDADLNNADWAKNTWDFPGIDTVEKLRAMLQDRDMTIAQFKKLPVYTKNLTKEPWLKDL